MPVSQANDLFSAEFSVFTQTATGNQVVRTLAYSIPPHLDGALFLVHPTVTYVNVTSVIDSLWRGELVQKNNEHHDIECTPLLCGPANPLIFSVTDVKYRQTHQDHSFWGHLNPARIAVPR